MPKVFAYPQYITMCLEIIAIPKDLIWPTSPRDGDIVIKLNRLEHLQGLCDGSKLTEVRSKVHPSSSLLSQFLISTHPALLHLFHLPLILSHMACTPAPLQLVDFTPGGKGVHRWTWVWFARTKICKGCPSAEGCEVWGGAFFLGESQPQNPRDPRIVDILHRWSSLWPSSADAVWSLICSMGDQCKGYRQQLVGWHFGGGRSISPHVPMAKVTQQTGFVRFKALEKGG